MQRDENLYPGCSREITMYAMAMYLFVLALTLLPTACVLVFFFPSRQGACYKILFKALKCVSFKGVRNPGHGTKHC